MPELGRYAWFTKNEYLQRQEKVSRLMEKYEIDGIFILQTENILYLTGYTSWLKNSKHRPFVTIMAKGQEPVLILPALQKGDAEGFSFIQDMRFWSDDRLNYYVNAFQDLGLDNKRVGVEIGEDTHLAMSLLEFEQLKAMLPNVTWIDCAPLMFEARKIKSPQEIEYLRCASSLADQAIENAWKALRPGVNERAISNVIARTFAEGGAEEIGFIIIRSTPEDLYMRNKMPTDRIIQKGDVISCDIGCSYRGYWSDMMRAASIDQPDELMAKGFLAAAMVNTLVREAIKPGMEIDELDKVRAKALKDNGLREWVPFIGHALGSTVHELPRIAGGNHEILESGLVFAVEPGVYFPPYVFNIEDVVVVTEAGYESLNNYPRELYIAK
jgi:Xaa-Pro dipeptidase